MVEDHMVRCSLITVQGKIRRWARKYSASDVQCETLTGPQKSRIIAKLDGYCAAADWESLRLNLPPRMQPQICGLLAEAMVAKTLFDGLFCNPFFMLPQTDWHPALPSQTTLLKLYATLEEVDCYQAYLWRSSLIDLLLRCPGRHLSSILNAKLSLLSENLLGSMKPLLSPFPDTTERDNELKELFVCAGDLAVSLWQETVSLTCYDLNTLELFIGTPAVEAHLLHGRKGIDEASDVFLMTQPTVAAYIDGSDDCTIWAAAAVCASEKG